jgi:SH3-like domain-containing protein
MMRMTRGRITAALALAAAAAGGASAQMLRPVPYWASLSAGEARMRTGPGRNYPASWLYRRAGLPVRVIQTYPGWRKLRDPDGGEGWMMATLLTANRTAIVRDGGAELRDTPNAGSRVAFHAAAGVVGRLSKCDAGWCRLDVAGRGGFVEAGRLWGVDPGESVD